MSAKSVAIVTGASQGIGEATAIRLARDFAAVVLVARGKDNLEKTAVQVRSVGAEAALRALRCAWLAERSKVFKAKGIFRQTKEIRK